MQRNLGRLLAHILSVKFFSWMTTLPPAVALDGLQAEAVSDRPFGFLLHRYAGPKLFGSERHSEYLRFPCFFRSFLIKL